MMDVVEWVVKIVKIGEIGVNTHNTDIEVMKTDLKTNVLEEWNNTIGDPLYQLC
jgi:hypothetical protein